MKSESQVMAEAGSISQSPRRLRAKYTHRTNFVYALCISPLQGETADRRIVRKQVPMHLLTAKQARAGKENAYKRKEILDKCLTVNLVYSLFLR